MTDKAGLSGKWVQRVPRTLHSAITTLAAHEGVSLNAMVTSLLAYHVGLKEFTAPQVTRVSAGHPIYAHLWKMACEEVPMEAIEFLRRYDAGEQGVPSPWRIAEMKQKGGVHE